MLYFSQEKRGTTNMDKATKNMHISNKLETLIVFLYNIDDKLCSIETEIGKIRTKMGQNQTKQSFTTKPLINPEDYE